MGAAHDVELEVQWPVFHRELSRLTPFQATMSFPLLYAGGDAFGALDCYSVRAHWWPDVDVLDVQSQLVDYIAAHLLAAAAKIGDVPASWTVQRREQVGVAAGMMMVATGRTDVDAVALMRGYAYSTGQLLDDLIVTGYLTTGEVLTT